MQTDKRVHANRAQPLQREARGIAAVALRQRHAAGAVETPPAPAIRVSDCKIAAAQN
jgi:hypothetical protein